VLHGPDLGAPFLFEERFALTEVVSRPDGPQADWRVPGNIENVDGAFGEKEHSTVVGGTLADEDLTRLVRVLLEVRFQGLTMLPGEVPERDNPTEHVHRPRGGLGLPIARWTK
jgi:hypothetical protein